VIEAAYLRIVGQVSIASRKRVWRPGLVPGSRLLAIPSGTGAPNSGCIPPPFQGDLLQVMPWPNFKDLTEHEMRAIYEYLKAVPCIQGNYPGIGGPLANIPPEPADRCTE
jgi:hypothetical protein